MNLFLLIVRWLLGIPCGIRHQTLAVRRDGRKVGFTARDAQLALGIDGRAPRYERTVAHEPFRDLTRWTRICHSVRSLQRRMN
jgi:hypothetical protein